VVHGDLSDFNVLMSADGPVIIDFPQSVDAAANHSAKKLLLRDVDNLTRFLMRLDHRAHRMPYGQEIWSAYERNRLTPGMSLTGRAQRSTGTTDTRSLLDEIAASDRDEEHRRRALGLPPRRREVTMQPSGSAHGRGDGRREPRNDGRGSGDRRAAPGEPRHDARPSDRRGPPGPPRNEGRGPADRRAGPGDSRGDARGPAGRREAPAEARSDRGPENGRAAPPREQRDGQAGQQDGAPRKRRRRRKKPGNGAAPGATIHAQHGAATNGAPHARTDGEASDPRVRERSHDPHRPREVAASPEANGSSEAQRARNGTHDASGAPGPSKRRRRRRRRSGEGQPPTGHPGGAA
jgi:RIO kinase 1